MNDSCFLDLIEQERTMLKRKVAAARDILDSDLVGTLNQKNERGRTFFYCYRGKGSRPRRLYLGDRFSKKMDAYMENSALLEIIEGTERDIEVLGQLLDKYQNDGKDNGSIFSMQYSELLKKNPRYLELLEWQCQDYDTNTAPMPAVKIYASDGRRMRSKDECIEHNELSEVGLPFRYDSVVEFKDDNGNAIYESPDFLVRCFDGTYIILEHLGLLEEDWYVSKNWQKLHIYAKNGYTLNHNLFLTGGTGRGGVDLRSIKSVIRQIETRFWQTFRVDE